MGALRGVGIRLGVFGLERGVIGGAGMWLREGGRGDGIGGTAAEEEALEDMEDVKGDQGRDEAIELRDRLRFPPPLLPAWGESVADTEA
jgi:hypothetical protein